MPRIFAFFISAILLITGIGYVLYEIFKFLGVSRMSRGRRSREMTALLNSIQDVDEEFASWSSDEIELLSAKFEYKRRKHFFSKVINGRFQTIYGEPLVAFAARVFTPNQYILVFKTSLTHYVLVSTGVQIQAYAGSEMIGVIKNGVLNVNHSLSNEIRTSTLGTESIVVNNKDLAIYKTSYNDARTTDRFFEMVANREISNENIHVFTLLLGHVVFKRILGSS